MLSNGIFILINVSCNISYATQTLKNTCFCVLPEIVSCRINITVDRILVIDCNSMSSKCIGSDVRVGRLNSIFVMYTTYFIELWSITSFILSFVDRNSEVYLGCRHILLWICLEKKQQSNIPNMEIILKFKTPLTELLNVIVLDIFPSPLQIYHSGTVKCIKSWTY
jgi:hypothetical protein